MNGSGSALAPSLSTTISSTAGSGRGSSWRPGRSGLKVSPSAFAKAPFRAVEDLRARAEVGLQRGAAADALKPRATLLEQLDVGVAEAVDRLLRITDHEQVEPGDEIDQFELNAVGVLHLVDHHTGEPLAVAVADLARAQQIACEQLEI